MIKRFFWRPMARFLARPRVAAWLIAYAQRTPYMHLPSNEDPSYMGRWWVFNPYDRVTNKPRWAPLIPFSIRVHHIKRPDLERHMHDHPWDARTIILRGWYIENRLIGNPIWRRPGDTARIGFEQYHRITDVSPDGVWTLFISWKWKGVWGFLVDGVKVNWREYLK